MLAIGQTVTVRARSFPGREFIGSINVIYPEINKETRTARVRVELANPDLVLLHASMSMRRLMPAEVSRFCPSLRAQSWTPAVGRRFWSIEEKAASSRAR